MNYPANQRSPNYSDQLNSPNIDYRRRLIQSSPNGAFGDTNTRYQTSSSNAFDMGNSYGPNSEFNRANDCRDNGDRNCEKNMFGK